jgi:hypothetical protein
VYTKEELAAVERSKAKSVVETRNRLLLADLLKKRETADKKKAASRSTTRLISPEDTKVIRWEMMDQAYCLLRCY